MTDATKTTVGGQNGRMTATVHDAVSLARQVLLARGNADLAGQMAAAYTVVAADPLSRIRVPSILHVCALMDEIMHDEAVDSTSRNAASSLYLRIGNAIGMVDQRSRPEPERGILVDHRWCTYRVDGDNVLHYQIRHHRGFVVWGLRIRVVSPVEVGPPLVAAPGLRTGRHPPPDEEEQTAAWEVARTVVATTWVLGLWEGRDL